MSVNENRPIGEIPLGSTLEGATLLGTDSAGQARRFDATSVNNPVLGIASSDTSPVGNARAGQFYWASPGSYPNFGNLTIPRTDNGESVINAKIMRVGNGWQARYDTANVDLSDYIPNTEKGAANGVATLDSSVKVPSNQLDIDVNQQGGAGRLASSDNLLALRTRIDTTVRQFVLSLTRTTGLRLNGAGSQLSAGTNEAVTPSLPVNVGDQFRIVNHRSGNLSGGYALLAFYDANDVFIASQSIVVGASTTLSDSGLITPDYSVVKRFRTYSQNQTNPIIYLGRLDYNNQQVKDSQVSLDFDIVQHRIRGGYLNTLGNVNISNNTNHFYTQRQPIEKWSEYRLQNIQGPSTLTTLGLAFYNGSGDFIEGLRLTSNQFVVDSGRVTPPLDARWFALSGVWDVIPRFTIFNTKQALEQLRDQVNNFVKPFVMAGDSIGNGIANALIDGFQQFGYQFRNIAVGGENVLDTSARWGSVPFVILPPFTMPSSETAVLTIGDNMSSRKGWSVVFDPSTGLATQEGSKRINPSLGYALDCTIAGVPGRLTFDRNPNRAWFTRFSAGDSFQVNVPVEVAPLASYAPRDSNITCFMGTNGAWTVSNTPSGSATLADLDNLVNFYKLMRDHVQPQNNNYLFTGFYETSNVLSGNFKELMGYFENKMWLEFGKNYFNVREYLMTDVRHALGISEWTTGDIDAIVNRGRIPLSVRSQPTLDQVHLRTAASRAIANKLFEKWFELGATRELIKIDVNAV